MRGELSKTMKADGIRAVCNGTFSYGSTEETRGLRALNRTSHPQTEVPLESSAGSEAHFSTEASSSFGISTGPRFLLVRTEIRVRNGGEADPECVDFAQQFAND